MTLAEKSFKELFPEKEFNFETKIKYSGKVNPYNANVHYNSRSIQFNLSREWKKISEDIRIGLIQSLLLKIFKEKGNTINIDLYNKFMKNIHIAIPKDKSHPILEESFNRVNEKYFNGLVEKPNLVLGSDSVTKLGSYEFGSHTITLSNVLLSNENLLDYVMYHEMLHKKHKFQHKNGRNYHHTSEFLKKEKDFENSLELEKELKMLPRKFKKKEFLDFLFR